MKDLQKSLPGEAPWIFWQVLEAGQLLQTPPGFVRAKGLMFALIFDILCPTLRNIHVEQAMRYGEPFAQP